MVAIEKDERGGFAVRDGDRLYGRYPSEAMAMYRVAQVIRSRRPAKKPKARRRAA